MIFRASKQYAKNKRAKQQKKRHLTYIAIALISMVIVVGGIFAFRANAQRPQSEPQVATFANPDNPECPYQTPLVERPTESIMETHLDLDLSQGGTAHNVSLVVPSSKVAFVTDGRIMQADELQAGDAIYMTGDKIGVVQSIEHALYTPESIQTDGKGNVYSRVLGKSERFVETMLYLYTANEVIKTTPEHPFYVGGVYVEAQYLNPGDQIRSRTGNTIAVERTEIVNDPQMVYSLMVEGTHNFYVGEEGLLAHNCTSVFRDVNFRGLVQNRNIPDLRYNQIKDALTGQGLNPTHHFIEQLQDPRTQRFGVNTLNYLQGVFNHGVVENADDGLKALVHGQLAVVFDPSTGNLVTIRPWD